MIQASAPGKLFIAGEYAVVTNGHPAVLVAVDQFITVSLEHAEDAGSIHSSLNGGLPIPWTRQNGKLFIDERENPFVYITQAVKVTETYIKEQDKHLEYFHLSVESELDNARGKKYGLGSSGAVTVATIKALLKFYELEQNPELVYKLASLAHLSVKSNGSFGDIAASSYTGWIAYSCFDRDWVRAEKEKHSITELVQMAWPDLMIRRLNPVKQLKLLIGWTGSPASTTLLVDKVNDSKQDVNKYFSTFLRKSKSCVKLFIQALEENDLAGVKNGIRKNRQLLSDLAGNTGVLIETKLLTKLIKIAENYGGASKTSGAGGGDCGIVLIDAEQDLRPLLNEWKKAGIQHLDLGVYQED